MYDMKIAQIKAALPSIEIEKSIRDYTGTSEFYIELLTDWCNAPHLNNMCQAFEAKDYTSYRLSAHSLKGTSRAVGLSEIGNLCEALQFAADNNDIAFIESEHKKTVSIIKNTIDTVIKYL